MQTSSFEVRNSAAHSVDDRQSRYVPSSIYSGPGPAEESPLPIQQFQASYRNGAPGTSLYDQSLPQSSLAPVQYRSSPSLNASDPVAMHLLMETAILDSKSFEILSFDELEHLKKRRIHLKTKLDGVRRQLAIERKMNLAAQELNRLYSSSKSFDELSFDSAPSIKQNRSSVFAKKGAMNGQLTEELNASSAKIEKLVEDASTLEQQLQDTERRLLQHTAGILQMTHRGLKKNVRKNELPRSPESMASQARSSSRVSDFDDRSLYQVPDYVYEQRASPTLKKPVKSPKEMQPLDDIANRLHMLSTRIHDMILQAHTKEHFEVPPSPSERDKGTSMSNHIKDHLTYMAQGLEAVAAAQQSAVSHAELESAEHVDLLNEKLSRVLDRTSTGSRSPIPRDEQRGLDLQSQLAYSDSVLERLNARVDALVEQKEILTRQIQQQRELNSKSDAQRDAQIRDLTEELSDSKQRQVTSEQEMHHAQNQISLLMEQLDRSKQDEVLAEQQRGMKDNEALETERSARKAQEVKFMEDIEAKQNDLVQLQADHTKIQHDFELRSQQHTQQLNDLQQLKDQAQLDATKYREKLEAVQAEQRQLESQMVSLQTELTMAKAELDGAYGTRAQRANDVSMNPAIKKEMDDLNARNTVLEEQLRHLSEQHETKGVGSAELQNKVNTLQKELRDTIDDYGVMTKASVEFEKERDHLEASIDALKEQCEELQTQMSEDRVKWLGVKHTLPSETVSTTVLKNEFKKMMRDTRTETMRVLKVSDHLVHDEARQLTSIGRTRATTKTRGHHPWSEERDRSEYSCEVTTRGREQHHASHSSIDAGFSAHVPGTARQCGTQCVKHQTLPPMVVGCAPNNSIDIPVHDELVIMYHHARRT